MKQFPLHEAVLVDDLDLVVELVGLGIDLDALDDCGHSALHWAVFGGYIDVTNVLLEAGANPNTFSADGVTPCWRAVDFGLVHIEALLRQYGGKIITNSAFDQTAFSVFNHLIGQPLPTVE